MRFYIVNNVEMPRFLQLAGSVQDDTVLEQFDERVLPATAQFVAEPRLDSFLAAYTGILDDYGILIPPAPTELDEITQGACAWMMIRGDEAPELKKRIARVKITEDDIANYLGKVSQSVASEVQILHRQLIDAIGKIEPAQTALLRCDL
jgi:hypothetical protein